MTSSQRLRRHLQSNVVGYLALFVALSGTAIALPGKGSVKSNDIARGAVEGRALASKAVGRSKLRSEAVGTGKLSAAAVTTPKLAAAAVGATQLSASAVTSEKLADDAVVRRTIGQGEINGGKLANGSVNSAKVADGTLLAEDFGAGQISDGFAFTTQADAGPATEIPGFEAAYNAPRAGRLLLTASTTAFVECAAACGRELTIYVDDQPVPGSTRVAGTTIPPAGGSEDRDLVLTGIVAVGAGPHAIEVRRADVGVDDAQSAFANSSISGVLLQ